MMSKPTIARPLQSDLTMLLLVKLYRNIFRMLHTPDLKQLCLVSKTLRKEAESILYETCSVPDGMLDLFCRTLVEHPELRRHVRVLSCTMMGHRGIIERDHDLALISQGLKSLHNLRDLTISGSFFPMAAWTISINDIDILRSATFKLKRLSCIFVYDDRLIDFLSSQPSIETFIHSWGADADSGPTTETPLKVKKLSCVPHILQTMRVTPALSHLRLEFRYLTALQEHQGARCIRQFGHNLVSLCVLRYAHPDEYFPMARIIASFASYTPNLKFLSIFDEYIDHVRVRNIPHLLRLRPYAVCYRECPTSQVGCIVLQGLAHHDMGACVRQQRPHNLRIIIGREGRERIRERSLLRGRQ